MTAYLLEVEHLALSFQRRRGLASGEAIKPVADLSLKIKAGEILAVAGSSGSGKSLLASAILGLLPSNCRQAGLMKYEGRPLDPARQKALRGRDIRLIPQSVSYLNPLYTLGRQLQRAARLGGVPPRETAAQIRLALARCRLKEKVLKMYPHQLSGGMARRILTATATLGHPKLLIADEPTTGLDGEIRQESLKHLKSLADEGCGVIIITHDLASVAEVADLVTVFHEGLSVETFKTALVTAGGWEALKHPYARALWRALPSVDFWAGLPQDSGRASSGCPFAPRCDRCLEICFQNMPAPNTGKREYARCHA